MPRTPGVRLRVFGWSETWRIIPEPAGNGWSFRIGLDTRSFGREVPPFLEVTEWTAGDLSEGLARIKEEIRQRAAFARKRAFMVDEESEDL